MYPSIAYLFKYACLVEQHATRSGNYGQLKSITDKRSRTISLAWFVASLVPQCALLHEVAGVNVALLETLSMVIRTTAYTTGSPRS